MSVILRCPNLCCPAVLRAAKAHRGAVMECSVCGTRFIVPTRPGSPVRDEPVRLAESVGLDPFRIAPLADMDTQAAISVTQNASKKAPRQYAVR